MNLLLLLVLTSFTPPMALPQAGPVAAQKVEAQAHASRLVHVVVINMSGRSREAHVRDQVVALPVSETVALQAAPGACVKITSDTNRHVARTIVLSTSDEGHVFAIE